MSLSTNPSPRLRTTGWVGLGGAVFIRSRTYSKRVINYRVRPYLWVVSGQGVAGGVYSK